MRYLTLIVTGVLAASFGTREAAAQSQKDTADWNLEIHEVTVTTSGARFTVSRSPARPVRLAVRTDSGTFTLSGDSAVLPDWVDSTKALPDPPGFVEREHVSFKVWQLKADGDSGAHMRFARLPTSHGADLAIALSNGVWGTVEHLGSQAPEVLAAIRGDSTALGDTAHVKFTLTPARTHPECYSQKAVARPAGEGPDTLCTARHVEQQARQKGGSSGPQYPPALQSAGVTGTALLAFIIDTTGRADIESIRLMKSTDPRFALACRRAIPGMEFVPARVDGRKVRELVQLPFNFRIPGHPDLTAPAK